MAEMLESTKAPKEGDQITPQSVQEQMHLTPQQAQQLERIVLAGRKVMFSAESHHLMAEQMDGPGPIAEKLGQGAAGLMGLLMQESKGSIPPNLIIPAGLILLAHAADFMRQAGDTVTDQDIAAGMGVMVSATLSASGIDPDKVAQIGAQAMQSAPKIPEKEAAK